MPVVITGKTYELRDRLKSLGGRWNNGRWEFYSLSADLRSELGAQIGVMISDVADAPLFDIEPIERPRDRRTNTVTNMFGDDPTWFNYFADQNPVAFFGFSSLSAFVDFIERTPQTIINDDTDNRNSVWAQRDPAWYGSECMADAIDIARDGWAEGVDMAQEIHEKLIGRHAIERRRKHSLAGGLVNVGRMLARNPQHMIARPKQPGKKVITFFTESAFSSSVKSEHVIIRAATIAAIVDILEMNGYSCEIVSTSNTRWRGQGSWQVVTTLKAAGETLALNDIVFALGHTSYFRRLCLGAMAHDPDLSDAWYTGGYPSDAFDRHHLTGANEIHLDRISHGDTIDGPTLIHKAMQIWDLITDDKLPVKLNREGIDA